MKKILLLFVLSFPVSDTFDIRVFLDYCLISGLRLQASYPTDSPHGEIMRVGRDLTVTIYEQSKPIIDTTSARRAGNSVFPGTKTAIAAILNNAIITAEK